MRDRYRGLSLGQLEEEAKYLNDALNEARCKYAPGQPMGLEAVNRCAEPMSEERLLKILFTYHNDPSKLPAYDAINRATRICAEAILKAVQACPDRTLALEHIRDARMRANAAVACDGVSF